ncbi:hypothetical protein B0J13DRAFT_675895 [Dactylonectria estremocensis]|uniref:Creatine transporter n=1 Tax=Dactylonectria estremocensis TaxID=1079267 RepID=A0A9P9J1G4_9HYPO|nr:hypothetical protein B0J13DRAFT_675895 [Dactylonectria estremocensis]
MGVTFKQVVNWIAPDAAKEEDGRDKWPSRAPFVLAAMGGAVGLGNLLRYPSVVFANNGLAWFIPYFVALFFLGIPTLILEICIGQAYRGSVVVAFNGINKHTKGVGLAVVMTGYIVATYYVPILAWIMHYFRVSFTSPLPWTGRGREFYIEDVIANPDPIAPTNSSDYVEYPATGMVVYFTMGLPVVMLIVILGRSLSLENAGRGVKYYFAEWNGWRLGNGDIWQGACGQIFFSIGVGFGYFTSYASYNTKYANAVQDSFTIGCCNSAYEIIGGFAVFGVIGYLGYEPGDPTVSLSTFTVGFLTYPLALAEMPGSNVFSVLFFLTLAVLGLSSAFALVESMVTLICDCRMTRGLSRPIICTAVIVVSFLLSLIYCTEFGFYLLDAVDTWTNNLVLLFVVWAELTAATTLYRYRDVCGQVGMVGYLIYSLGYILAMVLGVAVGQAVGPEAGAGTGFGIFILVVIASNLLSKTPDTAWWLAFYSGNQLRRDLNVIVATGNNWSIPRAWPFITRYISSPILAIVVSFAYPAFKAKSQEPPHIFAFTACHCVMAIIVLGFVLPRWFDIFVPADKLHLSKTFYAPQVTIGPLDIHSGEEAGAQVAEPDESSEAEARVPEMDESSEAKK